VTEEPPKPLKVLTELKELPALTVVQKSLPQSEKLVSVDTPRPSGDFEHVLAMNGVQKDKESADLSKKIESNVVNPIATAVESGEVKADAFVVGDDSPVEEMKAVAL
jgi:hypothetical protein